MFAAQYSSTPKIKLTTAIDEHGNKETEHRYVSVTRAPEPSDWWWEKTRFGGQRVVRRRIISWAAYVALLALSLFVMIYLNMQATVENNTDLTNALIGQQTARESRKVQ